MPVSGGIAKLVINHWSPKNLIRVSVQFRDGFLGTLLDPTNIFGAWDFGGGAQNSGNVVRDGVGLYHFDIDTTGNGPGTYNYEMWSTGTGQSQAQGSFVVDPFPAGLT